MKTNSIAISSNTQIRDQSIDAEFDHMEVFIPEEQYSAEQEDEFNCHCED